VTNLNAAMTCTEDKDNNYLTISNGLPTGLAANSEIKFKVDSFRNPISREPLSIKI
jgi:hypothetical protein